MAKLDGRGGDRKIPAGHLDLNQFVSLWHAHDFIRNDRIEIFVVDNLFLVGNAEESVVDPFKLLFPLERVAELGQTGPRPRFPQARWTEGRSSSPCHWEVCRAIAHANLLPGCNRGSRGGSQWDRAPLCRRPSSSWRPGRRPSPPGLTRR